MDTASLALWMIGLTVSLSMLIIGAAMPQPLLFMGMTGLVSLAIALLAVREHSSLEAAGASESLVGASTARNLGLVWLWGAIGLFVIYMFILQWREWWQLFLGLTAAGVLSLVFASVLQRDAEKGRDDPTMLRLGRYLVWIQLAGMAATIIGLAVDPDKTLVGTNRPDWAANNIFMFGAIAIGAISLHALLAQRKKGAV